jgi:O-antigen/teichoic acid export membrane protein
MSNISFGLTVKNILSIYGKRLLELLSVLVTVPIITGHFGLELMGIWLLVTQLSQHIVLLEVGLNTSTTRFLARFRAKKDLTMASIYLSSSVLTLITIGFIVVMLSPLIASGFASIFLIPQDLVSEIVWAVVVATVASGLGLFLRSGTAMLASKSRFDVIAFWETLVLAIRLVLIVIAFTWYDPNFFVLGLITFVPPLLGNIMIFLAGRRVSSDMTISRHFIKMSALTQLFSMSGAALLISMSAVILRQSSPMLLGWSIGLEQIALLAFPILIVFSVMPFVTVGATLISPVASQLDALDEHEKLYNLSVIVVRYVLFIACIIWSGFYYLGYEIFTLWLGGPKVDAAALMQISDNVILIFTGFVICSPGFIFRQLLIAVGRHWQVAFGEIIGALIGVSLGYILMVVSGLGVLGMTIGIATAFVVRGLGFLTVQCARYFEIPYVELVSNCFGRPIIVITVALILTESLLVVLSNYYSVTFLNVVSFINILFISLIGAWFWIIDPNHKRILRESF